MLVALYKASPDYLSLSAQTKVNYDDRLEYTRPLSDVALVPIDKPFIVKTVCLWCSVGVPSVATSRAIPRQA